MLQASITALLAASALLGTSNARNVLRTGELSLEANAALDLAAPIAAWKRAFADAPSGYTPRADNCPATRPSIRSASSLCPEETSWLESRRQNTVAAMRDLLGRLNIIGLDTNAYIDNNSNNVTQLPNIGLAFSGGGYRALMNGAGAVAAFDSRTPNSTSRGHIGGVLQSATYIAGLSGGSWLVGSIYVNNFTSVQDIINTSPDRSGSLWGFENSVLTGPATSRIQLLSTAQYYAGLVDDVSGKADAPGGFNTSLTDYWGRGLSYQLINATGGGPAYTWSSIADDPQFADGNLPLPFIIADGRAPGETLISSNTSVFEFNPWEMGTWDPTVFGFAPLRYTGSNFSAGVLPESELCVRGFDNAGFVMGTSSSLFNQILLQANTTSGVNLPEFLRNALLGVLQGIGEREDDISAWQPNPFYGYNNATNLGATSRVLTLVDGGEDLQNIPLYPLIQPTRNVDVILAVDSSADTTADNGAAAWPNGTALVATYQRSLMPIQNGTAFPTIPDQNTFVNLGLNTRPTFFGCDTANMTGPAPLVVYIPNAPYVYPSNVSTFTMSYNSTERNAIIQNGYDIATMGNGTVDVEWPTCLGCAVLARSLNRTGTETPEVCARCFERYCWNGTVNSATPPRYEPAMKLAEIKVSAAWRMVPSWVAAVVAVGVGLAVGL